MTGLTIYDYNGGIQNANRQLKGTAMKDSYYHNYPYPQGYSLPVNFRRFYFEDLIKFFGQFDTQLECYTAMLAYEGDNWVIPHVCGNVPPTLK